MRSGLFGGTFDPIHMGHLLMAETLCSDFPLDRIIFIPAAQPPHKDADSLTPAKHRMQMVQLAIEGNDRFQISDYEIQKDELCYTVDTVNWFQNSDEFCSDGLFLLMGADSLLELDTWKDPDDLLDTIQLLVFGRPDFKLQDAVSHRANRFHFVKTPLCGISSTQIRDRVKEGLSIRHWVPDSVRLYIQQEGLYQSS